MQRRRNSSVLPRLPAKESKMDNNFLFAFRSSSHKSHFLSLPQSVRPGKVLSVCHQSSVRLWSFHPSAYPSFLLTTIQTDATVDYSKFYPSVRLFVPLSLRLRSIGTSVRLSFSLSVGRLTIRVPFYQCISDASVVVCISV